MAEDKKRPVELDDESLEGVAGGLTDNAVSGVICIAKCSCGWNSGELPWRSAHSAGAQHETECSQGGKVTVDDIATGDRGW